MKELEHSEAPGTRTLKSLLKKPGQGKQRTHRNRVVINEKLNEFFAADYIILIKEECCADYEEECDCCCQETEMIRVGNCKECRAELSRHLASGIDPRYGINRHGEIDTCDDNNRERSINNEESQCEDEGEEEEEYEEEVDEYEEEAESSEEPDVGECIDKTPSDQKSQQQETLSPPEGYKDVCDEDKQCVVLDDEQMCLGDVCGECNYYQHRNSDGGEQCAGVLPEESTISQEAEEKPSKITSDPPPQTKPDLHQRYLVETITMTTVTERRIVREISEEDSCCSSISQSDTTSLLDTQNLSKSTQEDDVSIETKKKLPETASKTQEHDKDSPNSNELSLTFKLGNVSLVTNSLKPNSAVRQLFPDPRFISPPPVPAKAVTLSTDEGTDSDSSEAQRFLITTESLRLFDSVKRSKIAGSRSDSSESDSSSIKRTIERNALRRSLICKYDMSSKKKTLKSKDLSLEERIRRLTCVDQDDDNTGDSTSESQTNEPQSVPDFNVIPSGNEQEVLSTSNCQNHSPPLTHHHYHHQSAYRKITDLFGQKKIENMPDLGIGNGATLMKDLNKTNLLKMSTDARKQFLSSFPPLSCIASTGMDNGEDYYQMSRMVHDRNSISYNSDSSYSLEDIEAALRGEERNYRNTPDPPDVTRGTPTGAGPDPPDTTADELLAFVEQDKTRTERLKRKYDTDEQHEHSKNEDNNSAVDDEDDELNDYGFNTRPAVRGIKPQFQSTTEIMKELRSRAVPASLTNKPQVLLAPWSYYDSQNSDKNVAFSKETGELPEGRDNTIKRINTMQRQINDIYQTIAETTVSVQGTIDRGSYLESTLPRMMPRGIDCRYDQNSKHCNDQGGRVYSTLSTKSRRPVVIANYPCGDVPVENNKCYRTMYFVPYNGITDPTYQNIQRILPPHSSANYAGHIERYPFPRTRSEPERLQQPVPHLEQQSPRYYTKPPASETPPHLYSHPNLHLHLNQPENFRIRPPDISMQTVQLQHPQHTTQYAAYDVQSFPTYTVMAPSRAGGYAYSGLPARTALDVQTQTVSMTPMNASIVVTGFNGHFGNASSSSSTSSVLSSPTKIQEPRNTCCTEREAPEGAASASTHDFGTQANGTSGNIMDSYMGQPNNVSQPNTQNSLYYAMNV